MEYMPTFALVFYRDLCYTEKQFICSEMLTELKTTLQLTVPKYNLKGEKNEKSY